MAGLTRTHRVNHVPPRGLCARFLFVPCRGPDEIEMLLAVGSHDGRGRRLGNQTDHDSGKMKRERNAVQLFHNTNMKHGQTPPSPQKK